MTPNHRGLLLVLPLSRQLYDFFSSSSDSAQCFHCKQALITLLDIRMHPIAYIYVCAFHVAPNNARMGSLGYAFSLDP